MRGRNSGGVKIFLLYLAFLPNNKLPEKPEYGPLKRMRSSKRPAFLDIKNREKYQFLLILETHISPVFPRFIPQAVPV